MYSLNDTVFLKVQNIKGLRLLDVVRAWNLNSPNIKLIISDNVIIYLRLTFLKLTELKYLLHNLNGTVNKPLLLPEGTKYEMFFLFYWKRVWNLNSPNVSILSKFCVLHHLTRSKVNTINFVSVRGTFQRAAAPGVYMVRGSARIPQEKYGATGT